MITSNKYRFFVTGMGRSGTLWLSQLLGHATGVRVYHEPFRGWDRRRMVKHYRGQWTAQMWLDQRLPMMGKLKERHPAMDYGEVNSYLRYLAPELRDIVGAPVLGLVRDGRMVVRSLLGRGVYIRKGNPGILSLDGLQTPFEKCCWYWAETYRRMWTDGIEVFTLEGLNADYGYFNELCARCGMRIPQKTWRKYARRRIHVMIKDPNPPKFDREEARAFRHLAGDVQERYYAGTS